MRFKVTPREVLIYQEDAEERTSDISPAATVAALSPAPLPHQASHVCVEGAVLMDGSGNVVSVWLSKEPFTDPPTVSQSICPLW